ncbi:MAG: hypothetical protein IPP60_00835 [Sphingobacteriales bacterium]|nr:hypothetical protein [Sphingobacteriales bacterium]
MKKLIFILSAIFAILLSSCKKETSDSKPNIVGFWKGQYSDQFGTTPNRNYVFFKFSSDGSMIEYFGVDTITTSLTTQQTYTVTNDTIVEWESDYTGTGSTYAYRLVIRNLTTLVGSRGDYPNNNDTKLFLTKQ